ncbi:MAG: glycosyltransferase [Deltaproteobacteria bacterium]|nr:glycosyltransferase [Deltaproteobacteria bacterium]
MKTEVSICILTHNRSFHFAQCIASIRQFTKSPYVIKVLDVGSDLNHIEHMRQFAGQDIEFGYCADFLSCLDGRRRLLRLVDTEFVVYLDDDIRVGPAWLENLLIPMRNDESAGAVASNLIQEAREHTSGVRYLEQKGRALTVRHHEVNYTGTAPICVGGATLYRFDALQATEYRPEFAGGYEDWDQTLQISKDQSLNIYGSRSTVFHRHLPECRDYFADRWRWADLMESALGMFDRWKIRTAVDKVLRHYLEKEIVISREHAERIVEVIT